MAFDLSTAKISEVLVEPERGPFTTDAGHFMWFKVSVTFSEKAGVNPSIEISVPVDMSADRKWSEIEAEALAGAHAILKHHDLPHRLSERTADAHSGLHRIQSK